jgi:hypothetical protein
MSMQQDCVIQGSTTASAAKMQLARALILFSGSRGGVLSAVQALISLPKLVHG